MENTLPVTEDSVAPAPEIQQPPLPQITAQHIIIWPSDILKMTSLPVAEFNDELRVFSASLMMTCVLNRAYGISAVQVGNRQRVMVVMVDQKPVIMVNPVINEKSGEEKNYEGCLSVPGYSVLLTRAKDVTMTYQDLSEKDVVLDTSKLNRDINRLTAACIQHEIDHMDGVLFTDGLSEMRRNMARKKVKMYLRHQQRNTKI